MLEFEKLHTIVYLFIFSFVQFGDVVQSYKLLYIIFGEANTNADEWDLFLRMDKQFNYGTCWEEGVQKSNFYFNIGKKLPYMAPKYRMYDTNSTFNFWKELKVHLCLQKVFEYLKYTPWFAVYTSISVLPLIFTKYRKTELQLKNNSELKGLLRFLQNPFFCHSPCVFPEAGWGIKINRQFRFPW